MDKTPIYQLSAAYARENGELEQYHASRKLNRACKDAIEAAIQEHFDGTYLSKTAVDGVLKQFSPERVTYVLANTVQQQDWDGRFFPAINPGPEPSRCMSRRGSGWPLCCPSNRCPSPSWRGARVHML